MDTLTRLKQLMKQKKMSTYKLAQESGLPLSTITSLFRKGNCPTIPTLEGLCAGLGISLSEFFYEPGDEIPNDEETKQLLAKWNLMLSTLLLMMKIQKKTSNHSDRGSFLY